MTQTKLHLLNYRNAVTERGDHAQDVADAKELKTPFTILPGAALFDVTVRPAYDDNQWIVTLAISGTLGTESRALPANNETRRLVAAYAANARFGVNYAPSLTA